MTAQHPPIADGECQCGELLYSRTVCPLHEDMTPGEYTDAVREALNQLDGTEETAAAFVSREGPFPIPRNTVTE